ncbi:uncharacterized protein BYT42DRAFT_559949 [Radiomyces spectabilis]|uniref:uncharacterized protein n=1 Tax=Radiomyces spectabilis TaxID=64574 RepID=UPI00221E4245|nr:uncharacterized protein BYT42DRAFT_559949 [Radiomyces spectabilis]KAI8388403.1 hypothetical protein BYT42DRAFT_559949 [Radiomyces spectabilis]
MQVYYACFLLALSALGVLANTEKLIFTVHPTRSTCSLTEIASIQTDKVPILSPPYTRLQNAIIPFHDPPNPAVTASKHWYQLKDLQSDASYECRISYPAITPADFSVSLLDPCDALNHPDFPLNPKAVKTATQSTLTKWVLVEANYTGVSNIPLVEYTPVVYDIVLENLYAGFLFHQVYKIVLAIVGVLVLGQWWVIPSLKKLIISIVNDKSQKHE